MKYSYDLAREQLLRRNPLNGRVDFLDEFSEWRYYGQRQTGLNPIGYGWMSPQDVLAKLDLQVPADRHHRIAITEIIALEVEDIMLSEES